MSEDLKTIKELADELSVTRQNIQYHYQRLPKELQLKSSNGSNLINSKAEKIILDKVLPIPENKEIGHDLWVGLISEKYYKVKFINNYIYGSHMHIKFESINSPI